MKLLLSSIPVRTVIALIVFTILWTLLEHFLGFNTTRHEIGRYTRLFTAIVFYAAIGVAILQKRRQRGLMGFAEGFRTGLAVTLLYSLLATLWFQVYAELINPEYKPSLLAYERSRLEASGASAEEITSKMKELEMTSGGSITSYVMLFIFMVTAGLVVSLVASIVLRKTAAARSSMLTVVH